MTAHSGRSALVVDLPEMDAVVAAWRDRYDPSAGRGMQAHITVLMPFMQADEVDDVVLDELAAAYRPFPAFEVAFRGLGRFPGVLYLAPEPAEPFTDLLDAVTRLWPRYRPHGGRFDRFVPHLTLAQLDDEERMAQIEHGLAPALPVTAHVDAVTLVEFTGGRWQTRRRFPLLGGS